MTVLPMPVPEETRNTLPRATRDMARAFEDLDRFGYAIFEGALSRERVAALRARVCSRRGARTPRASASTTARPTSGSGCCPTRAGSSAT